MRRVSRSALVPYSTGQMFALVDDIESYPQFLPWCASARIIDRSGNTVEAELKMQRGALQKSFVTRNENHEASAIDMQLVSGPFRQLEGGWQFQSLGAEGSKVLLDLAFQFENRVLDMLIGPFFEDICNRLVDAFTQRASQVYGNRTADDR